MRQHKFSECHHITKDNIAHLIEMLLKFFICKVNAKLLKTAEQKTLITQ
jgi:hypothetical protein